MTLAQALHEGAVFQIYLPNRYKPLQVMPRPVGEMFLVMTDHGQGLVWVDPYWCELLGGDVCHLVYASPQASADGTRWIDGHPRWGPHCLAYVKPVIVERLDWTCSAWEEFERWQRWRDKKGKACGRAAAWQRVQSELADLHPEPLT